MKRTILSILFLLLPSLVLAQQALVISSVPTPSASCTIQRDAANTVWQCNSAVGISQPLTDSLGLIANAITPTKILKLDVSAITAATTRTWTIPDANITVPSTIASLGANVMTGLQTLNGGLAATTGTFSSTLGVTGASTIAALSATSGTFSSTLGVTGNLTLSGTGNAVGTITSGVWNAGAVTSSGTLRATNTVQAGNGGYPPGNPPSIGATSGTSMGFDPNVENGWIQAIRSNTSELRTLNIQPLGGAMNFGNGAFTIATGTTGAATFAAGVSATTGSFSGAGDSYFTGKLGIGTTGPGASLDVQGSNGLKVGSEPWPTSLIGQSAGRLAIAQAGGSSTLILHDNTAVAANTGPNGIYFTGRSNDTGPAYSYFGQIVGLKENATQNDSAGYIAFRTPPSGVSGTSVTEKMRITSAGNVVIGTTVSSAQLHTTGTVRFANFGAGTATFDASGNITSVSDERMKVIQGPFTPGLTALMGLRPILYHYTAASGLDTENSYAGFSAQNVLGYIPEAVGKNLDGLYSLNIVPVLAATVTAVQELAGEVDKLRAAMKMQSKVRAMVKVADERRIVNSATPKRLAEVAKQKADADKAKADKLAADAKAKIIK